MHRIVCLAIIMAFYSGAHAIDLFPHAYGYVGMTYANNSHEVKDVTTDVHSNSFGGFVGMHLYDFIGMELDYHRGFLKDTYIDNTKVKAKANSFGLASVMRLRGDRSYRKDDNNAFIKLKFGFAYNSDDISKITNNNLQENSSSGFGLLYGIGAGAELFDTVLLEAGYERRGEDLSMVVIGIAKVSD